MTSTELVGRDLDRALAEAMGQHVHDWVRDVRTARTFWCTTCGRQAPGGQTTVPDEYHISLDALRDGPERILREARMWQRIETPQGRSYVWWFEEMQYPGVENYPGFGAATTEAEARARAALVALLALKEARGEQ